MIRGAPGSLAKSASTRFMQSSIVALVFTNGCMVAPVASPEVEPDLDAVAVLVKDAYRQLGQEANVFLAVDGADDATMTLIRTYLGSELSTAFRPSSARAAGDPAASISLGRFRLGQDGKPRVVVSFVREDGAGRGCTEYALERAGDSWVIVQAADAWPNCPISAQGEESYHAVLARARSAECLGQWTNVGSCGEWLYIGEGLGFGGTMYYFDRATGLTVASESCTDVGDDPCDFGSDDCEPAITETILCDR